MGISRRSLSTLSLLLLCWLALTSCAARRNAATPSQLADRRFLLQSARGAALLAGVTVQLSFSDRELNFSARCNHHFGSYQLENGQLVMQGIGQTEMGCPAGEQQRDDWLEQFFLAKPRLGLAGNKLTLTSRSVQLVFLDRVVADPDRPLQGTPWDVTEYLQGGSAMGLMEIAAPRLLFARDGSWTLRAKCCEGAGKYTVEARERASEKARITITSADFTSRPCEAEHDKIATRFVRSVLTDGELRYRIKAGSLTLESDKHGLGLRDSSSVTPNRAL